jgi:hypothetical protein
MLPATNSGTYASNPQFSLGAAQVSVTDPRAGMVTASVIPINQFVVQRTEDNYELISHGVSLTTSGPGYVQVCFAYSPVKSDFKVVRWNPARQTNLLPGGWVNMKTFKQGPSICAKVPTGVFALSGL